MWICRTCENGHVIFSDETHPVDGQWQSWGPWSSCSASCGGGMRNRTRDSQPPSCGGIAADGSNVEYDTACNPEPCTCQKTQHAMCIQGKGVIYYTCIFNWTLGWWYCRSVCLDIMESMVRLHAQRHRCRLTSTGSLLPAWRWPPDTAGVLSNSWWSVFCHWHYIFS